MHPVEELSAEQARAIIVRAQGLDRQPSPEDGIGSVLRRLGAVQLDTISVLARSHELVMHARLGPTPRAEVERAYWDEPARTFEYVAHAACIIPLDLWPNFAFRRRGLRLRHDQEPAGVAEARARLKEGPLTTSDMGEARRPGGWWNWSAAKIALEWLYRRGEAVVTMRKAWKRVYDLPERVLPQDLRESDLSDEECLRELVALSARALGVGTAHDISSYLYLNSPFSGTTKDARRQFMAAVEAAGLVPVRVEGWQAQAFADPEALASPPRPASRTTLLSPFDSLIWAMARTGELKERERIRRVFGFSYAFEAYVKQDQRRHGYFTMPLLHEGRLVGRVDPRREGKTLVARSLSLEEPDAVIPMATALREAAAWVGCEEIRVERVEPAALAPELKRLVA
jgi:uncharacterized protein YcaQ